MQVAVDLHSHSGYAGGVGQIGLEDISKVMKSKGIDVFGTGDCILPQRVNELKQELTEVQEGIFSLKNDYSKFVLQTEVIFSTKLKDYKNKTIAHHVILFPSFSAVEKMQNLMNKWQMKNTIGRPFIVSDSQIELEEQLFAIQNLDSDIEIIPAHVLTPDGIMGSKNNLSSTKEFYGNFEKNIRVIETGLSADPDMLCRIPDFANKTMISNSDCHSAALNRIGREFTILEVTANDFNQVNYSSIIKSLRKNKVILTAEFFPSEGRYYLTGHRSDRKGHEKAVIFNNEAPGNLICPICGKKLLQGVKQRAISLSDNTLTPIQRNVKHLIPLVEVIAVSKGLKSVTSKKVINDFNEIIKSFSNEISLWKSTENQIKELLDKRIDEKTISHIVAVLNEDFEFSPGGCDGVYGKLIIH